MEFGVSPFCLREKHHLLSAWTWHISHAHVTFPWSLSGRAGGAAATQGVRSVYGSDQALTSAHSLEVSGPVCSQPAPNAPLSGTVLQLLTPTQRGVQGGKSTPSCAPALLTQLKHIKVDLGKMVIGEDGYTHTWDVSAAFSNWSDQPVEYDLIASVMKSQHYMNLKQKK